MSEVSGGPGWWQASDGKWYPPEQQPNYEAPAAAPSAGYTPQPSTPAARAAGSSFSFDMKRWSQVERITSIASLVLFISLFLPWYTFGPFSADGLSRGWMYIVFILSLAILIHFVLKAGMSTLPYKLPLPEAQLLLFATGINAVLVVIAFLLKPGGIGFNGVGWGFGAFIGLIAALVAAFPTALPALKARRM
jgi:hypothetical protein